MDGRLRTSKMLEAKVKEALDKSKKKIVELNNEILLVEKQNQAIEIEAAKLKSLNEEKKDWIETLKRRVEEERIINEQLCEEERQKAEEINMVNKELETFIDEAERKKFLLEEKVKRLQWENEELLKIIDRENIMHEVNMNAECNEIERLKVDTEEAKKTTLKLEKDLKAYELNDKNRQREMKKEQMRVLEFLSGT